MGGNMSAVEWDGPSVAGEYVRVIATGRLIEAYSVERGREHRKFVGRDSSKFMAVYSYDEVERYAGIIPPPEFMDADQYRDLMLNYD
jgi:hypothetical protein